MGIVCVGIDLAKNVSVVRRSLCEAAQLQPRGPVLRLAAGSRTRQSALEAFYR